MVGRFAALIGPVRYGIGAPDRHQQDIQVVHTASSSAASSLPDGRPLWHAAIDVPNYVEQPRRRAIADVIGGVLFAALISMCMIRISAGLFADATWASSIGWESVWICACMIAAPLLPSGIVPNRSMQSLLRGLSLDWPELSYAAYMLVAAISMGMPHGVAGPLGLALAVGTAEEMLFRVLILGWLVTRVRPEYAVIISAVIFGCAHLQEPSLIGILSVLPQTAGGIILGAMYLRSRNVLSCILAHAAWDFPIFLAYGLVSGGSTEAGMPTVTSLLPWIALSIYGLYLVRDGVELPGRPGRGDRVHAAGAQMHMPV